MLGIDLEGRCGLVLGVANHRSLAWAVAERLNEAGMRLCLTYLGDRMKPKVEALAEKLNDPLVLPCDVTDDAELDRLFETLGQEMPRLDALVHSVAFAQKEDLTGAYRNTSREGWRVALEISAYSLVAVMGRAAPMMAATEDQPGGSVVTMSYVAAERAIPNYNVMGSAKAALEHAVRQLALELGPQGIRVNAVSAGPVNTLSARGLGDFNVMLTHHREKACLKRNVEAREVGDASLFLLSDLGSGITGETLHVDAGYSIVGF
ncbi:MAG: enoyl-ACP reductase [Acidobacteriota bacterium]